MKKKLENNTLFNELSGFKTSGGIIGQFFSYLSDQLEKVSGLQEDVNENLLKSIGACRKFFYDKAHN